ncbi:MAG TPA: TolC family protein, partial [Candidatus Kapabacteria bacterium]|nr:TolC family protein [Candidatus Kapabacteria bacterium]
IIASLLLISPFTYTAFAQQQLTLNQCVTIGLDRNYTLHSSAASIQQTSGAMTAAFGQFLPGVSVNAGYSRNLDGTQSLFFTPEGVRSSAFSYSLSGSINYTIFNGFSNTAGYNQATNNYDAAENSYERTRQDIKYQIVQGYLNVERTEQLMKAQEDNLKVGKDQLEMVKAQYQVGSVPQANVFTQETQVANDQVAYIQAKNTWNTARNNLVALIGLDPVNDYTFTSSDLPTEISNDDEKAFRQKIGDIQTSVARALDQRPDVTASHNQIQSAESFVTVAHSGYYPNVSASVSYGWRNDQFSDFSALSSTSLGINLSMPIFDRFQTNSQVEAADASYQVDQANYEQLVQTVRTQVKQSYYDLEASEEQLDATKTAQDAADENRRTAEERYKVGAGTELDFLTAQSQYLTAEVNRINAVYSYLGAQYEVQYMTGVITAK